MLGTHVHFATFLDDGLALPTVNAVVLSIVVFGASRASESGLQTRPYVLLAQSLCLLYIIQLSGVAHELGHAYVSNSLSAASTAKIHVPAGFYVPVLGFCQATNVYTIMASLTRRADLLWAAQAGFGSQFVYLQTMSGIIFDTQRTKVCLTVAVGFVIYLFVYPHVTPEDGNDFRWW